MSDERRGEVAIGAVVLIWGANFAVIKTAVNEIPPFAFAAVRFVIATAILLLLLRLREGSVKWPAGTFKTFLALGLLANTIYQSLFMMGIARTTAGNTALMIAPTPVLIAVIGSLTGVERLTRPVALGAGATFVGVALVASANATGPSLETFAGDLMVLGASLCWSLYTVAVRATSLPVSALKLTTLTMVTGTPGLVLLGAGTAWGFDWAGVSAVAYGGMAYATLLGLIVAYVLWNFAVKALGGSRAGVFASLIPVVALIIAAVLLHERPGPFQLAGTALILGGVVIARRKVPERESDTEETGSIPVE